MNVKVEEDNNALTEQGEKSSALSVGGFLEIVGCIMWFIGGIGGLCAMELVGIVQGIVLGVSVIIIGVMIFGLGEIINTLNSIDSKLK